MSGIPRDIREDIGLVNENGSGSDPAKPFTPFTPKDPPSILNFSVEAMPQACQRLIKEAAKAAETPPEFVALPMLVVLGSAIGNARRLEIKGGWSEGATIYGASIADPGAGKSPAQRHATKPAKETQARLRKEYRDRLEEYEYQMRKWKMESKQDEKDGVVPDDPPKEPVMERTIVGDTTVEALAVILNNNPRGVFINNDELTGWVRGMDQYKGGKGSDRPFYLSAWSGETAQVVRKGQAETTYVQRPFCSIYGSIQPAVLPDLRDGREDGMLERFLFSYPDKVIGGWTDDEVSVKAERDYAHLYDALRDLEMVEDENGDPQPQLVKFTKDAKLLYAEQVNELRDELLSPGFPSILNNYWPKLKGYLARLSLILAMSRHVAGEGESADVEVGDLLKASTLLGYFKSHAYRVFVSLHGDDLEERLSYDLACFLVKHGGIFEGTPGELYEALESKHKPGNASWLVKKIMDLEGFDLQESTVGIKSENTKTGRTTKRNIRLAPLNGVNGVNAMMGWREAKSA